MARISVDYDRVRSIVASDLSEILGRPIKLSDVDNIMVGMATNMNVTFLDKPISRKGRKSLRDK